MGSLQAERAARRHADPGAISFGHLRALMGPQGLFEHALHRRPRPDHGYTTDDNGRALMVTAAGGELDLFERCLGYVSRAFTPDGFRNRLSAEGSWIDEEFSEDAHGRAVWGLGVALGHDLLPDSHLPMFAEAARRPLGHLRSTVYSLLGASAALQSEPGREVARRAVVVHAAALPAIRAGAWAWPETRLTYDNARLPQAMILAGEGLGDGGLVDTGLELLTWLVGIEWAGDHFSFTPVGGRGPDETGPLFDQQPLEAWAMADACRAAFEATGDRHWAERARSAISWFLGDNDVGAVLYDSATGACYDGLEPEGVNLNCGAESTIAGVAAMLSREAVAA